MRKFTVEVSFTNRASEMVECIAGNARTALQNVSAKIAKADRETVIGMRVVGKI